jgi:SAM-dependent methyltransferase
MDMPPPYNSDHLVPAPELLFDGSRTAEQFKLLGEGFTRVNLINRGHLKKGDRVLDIGSGNGQKARVLAYYLDPSGSYEGLDVVAAGIQWCQERYAPFPNFRFQTVDVRSSHYNRGGQDDGAGYRLPFPDADFDMVFLCSVFTHMLTNDVANYIREIGRVLKPGGRCIATFFLLNRDSLARIEAGTGKFAFVPLNGAACLVLDPTNPSKAVAHDENWVREQFAASGLHIAEATYGTWCGAPDMLGALQDAVFSVRE